jgi:hypothetical protein
VRVPYRLQKGERVLSFLRSSLTIHAKCLDDHIVFDPITLTAYGEAYSYRAAQNVNFSFLLGHSLQITCQYSLQRLVFSLCSYIFVTKHTRQTYVQRNIEARSYNYYSRGKAISVAYSECALVALGAEHEVRMRRIVICGLSSATTFFHDIS